MTNAKKSSVPSGHVRKTFDLPEEQDKKLSILAARMGTREVNIVRALLDQALKNVQP